MRRTLGILFLLVAAVPVRAQPAIPPPEKYAAAVTRVEQLVRHELEAKKLPAISIALVDDQTVVWAKGFGFADAAKKVPATAETVHRVGSVSKLFTDVAVMQLVEAGKLDLDAPVTKYLPEFQPKNPSGKPITLRHLMAHRAGLVREPPIGNYFDDVNLSLAQMVESLNRTELVYPPGQKIKYSNAGVATVGYVLQQTQKGPFAKCLKRTLLEPLGMRTSGFQPTPELTKDRAQSIMWTLHGREFPAPTFELGMAPAGSMYSTVNDLALFVKMMAAGGKGPNGRVLKAETLEEMWKPQFAKTDEKSGIGIGFIVEQRDGRRHIGHNGAIYGFATELGYLPEEKVGAVVAISCDCANPVAAHIADFALDCLLAAKQGKPLPKFEETQPMPAELRQRLVGRWTNAKGDRGFDLTESAGRLWSLSLRGGARTELRLAGNDLIMDDRLGFGTRLKVESETLLLGEQKLNKREVPKPAAVPPKWAGLIGEYGPDHDILYIMEREGNLCALIEWFFLYPLAEESETVFRFPDFGLYHDEKIIFQRDASGRATKAVAASVDFVRRKIDGENGETFKIQPVRQLDGLRKEALAAAPPKEAGRFRQPELVDLAKLEPTLKLDIRYATTNNFLGTPFYTSARAFMQKPAADALVRAHKKLVELGYGLLIHDAYRPWYVTKMFWEATPEKWHNFVADPLKGSRHNRGCAVDLTFYDLKTGKVIEMPGGYDEFSDRSYPDYPAGTSLRRWHRDLLRRTMEAEGFTVYEAEWWHFDYKDWREYPILNSTFEKIEKK